VANSKLETRNSELAKPLETRNSELAKPLVYLVGAGPGDSGMLTLRGKECLEQADFVLYDQLVSRQILNLAPRHAELLCVRELASTHPERLPYIHEKLIDEARKGKCVVRLKGGDPLLFGRGGEEAQALRDAGIPYEIVPGVTAALAAAACLEIPLTHRSHASAVAFVTGHEDPAKPTSRIDWQAIARFPGTLVIYMGLSRLGTIAAELIRHGKDETTPAAAVTLASSGEQRSIVATLAGLDHSVREAGLTTPVLILIGPVVGLRPTESWFESRPLFGMGVLVTRPRRQAESMLRQFELLGAAPHSLPIIEIDAPADWSAVDDAIRRLKAGGFDWLVFTSANGVEMFMNRLQQVGGDSRALGTTKLAAIGPSTEARLHEYFLRPDLTPKEDARSETLTTLLKEHVRGQRVLLAQAEQARDLLQLELAGIADVEKLTVYRQAITVDREAAAYGHLQRGEIDCVTLTSPAIANGFLAALDESIAARIRAGDIRLVTNGPRISAAVRAQGFSVSAESKEPTIQSLMEALIDMWQKGG
jgi:uroporphyrinogen III methyltransferase / synthase